MQILNRQHSVTCCHWLPYSENAYDKNYRTKTVENNLNSNGKSLSRFILNLFSHIFSLFR